MAWTDSEIISRFREPATRDQAFKALVQQYQERIYWHARRMAGNHEDADDITQNVFIKIWKHLDGYREDAALYSYIYRIVANESLSLIEKRKKHLSTSMDESPFLHNQLTAHQSMDEQDVTGLLEAAINTLPAKQKQVFIMRYYDELKYEDMAELLQTSVGALKASYHHALKKMEKILKGD
jgi:RNA polymerase sigma factor (sigma-70 family)